MTRIILTDREIIRKYKISVNYYVSDKVEHFDSDGRLIVIGDGRRNVEFGVSKMQHVISSSHAVDGLKGLASG